MTAMRAVPIPPHLAADALPTMQRFLGPVCSRPMADITLDDLAGIVAREEGMLALVVDGNDQVVAAGVTQIRDYEDGRRVCWLLAMGGGRAREWRHTLQDIEDGARRAGCASVEFVGRKGWARLLSDYRTEPCERGVHFSKSLRH